MSHAFFARKICLCISQNTEKKTGRAKGLYLKYIVIFPRKREMIALVMPHVGHVIPKRAFIGHVISRNRHIRKYNVPAARIKKCFLIMVLFNQTRDINLLKFNSFAFF